MIADDSDCSICSSNSTLETLWNQLHGSLRRFIASRLPNEDDADDILQEVFLRIHTRLETVRDMDKLESWIYQIARNSIIDYYRSRRKLVGLAADLAVEDEHQEEDAAAGLAPSIQEIVQALPEPYREALILTEYQGLSQKEMADRLGISLSGQNPASSAPVRKSKTCCWHAAILNLMCAAHYTKSGSTAAAARANQRRFKRHVLNNISSGFASFLMDLRLL
ncbi:MAG: sigma-70 family RNA polymerase sigma factor [Anaerolineaceae bacterium]|nr:sigma-70 family RNA polymerase sigma factor [Anaerolineaceae bacterium]